MDSVEELASDCVDEQKLPKPCVGYSGVSGGTLSASRCADRYWACASGRVARSPSRSGRPVDPYSSAPPLSTPWTRPSASTTYDRWVNVWPGVCRARTVIDPAPTVSPSCSPWWSKPTSSAADSR